MIKKLLCLIGFHNWKVVGNFPYGNLYKCQWCGKDGNDNPYMGT